MASGSWQTLKGPAYKALREVFGELLRWLLQRTPSNHLVGL
jgi:hypothetical protein